MVVQIRRGAKRVGFVENEEMKDDDAFTLVGEDRKIIKMKVEEWFVCVFEEEEEEEEKGLC